MAFALRDYFVVWSPSGASGPVRGTVVPSLGPQNAVDVFRRRHPDSKVIGLFVAVGDWI